MFALACTTWTGCGRPRRNWTLGRAGHRQRTPLARCMACPRFV